MFAGAVLAGGSSSRMGRDKAGLTPPDGDGRPLVTRSAEALVGAGIGDVVVVGGDAQAIGSLGLEWVADRWPTAGPLGGLVTVLAELGGGGASHAVVLACDLLAPNPDSVLAVMAATVGSPGRVTVPLVEGRRQWMHACWPVSSLPVLQAGFSEGERSLHRLAVAIGVTDVAGIDPASVADADKPGDLLRPDSSAGSGDR